MARGEWQIYDDWAYSVALIGFVQRGLGGYSHDHPPFLSPAQQFVLEPPKNLGCLRRPAASHIYVFANSHPDMSCPTAFKTAVRGG